MSESNEQDLFRDPSLIELCDALLEEESASLSEEARRPLLEALSLMPFGLEEVAPDPSVKERLFAEIAAGRSVPAESPGEVVRSMADHRARTEAPRTEELAPPSPASGATPVSVATPGSGWMLPLAAGLLLAVAAFALFQSTQMRAQSDAIASLENQFTTVKEKLAAIESDRDLARTHLAAVSRPGTEVCALKPRLASAPEGAHGTLYVMPGGEGWVLSLNGLDDVPGKTYQMWFVGKDGATSAGTFLTGSAPYEWTHDKMPPMGTQAVAITLESEGGAESPTGPEILFGDAAEMVSFL